MRSHLLIRVCLDVGNDEWFGMKMVSETGAALPGGAGAERKSKNTGTQMQNKEGGFESGCGVKRRHCGLFRGLIAFFGRREQRDEKKLQKAKEQEQIRLQHERQEVLNKVEEGVQKLLSDILDMIGSLDGCFCVYEDSIYRALEGRKNDNCIVTGNVPENCIQEGKNLREICVQEVDSMKGTCMPEENSARETRMRKESSRKDICVQEESRMNETCMPEENDIRKNCAQQGNSVRRTCVQEDRRMNDTCLQKKAGIEQEIHIQENKGRKISAGMEAMLPVLWKKYFQAGEFEDYTKQLWVEELLPEAVLPHFVILGTASCLYSLIEKYAGRMKSLRWIMPENDYSLEVQEFVEDFYTEYGLAIMLQITSAGQRGIQAVCTEPSNVLDFTQEACVHLAKVAKGSIWLDMLSVEEKKRRIAGRSTGISYVSLKEKWRLARKKEPFVPEE